MRSRSSWMGLALLFVVFFGGAGPGWAQEPQLPERDSLSDAVHALQAEIRELQQSVRELREESASFRAEAMQLRGELARGSGAGANQTSNETSNQTMESAANQVSDQSSSEQRMSRIEEEVQLLDGKVDEQYQTKVESASKYRVRLSGIALFNLFSNRGAVDNLDNPSLAQSPTGAGSRASFGGTVRQSIVGLEVFGPRIAGARTSGDVQFDFAGGFPMAENGVTFGEARLRTARLRLQWGRTSVIAGQDSLFFAPLAPTSFASLSTPALSYAGNLWAWLPQVRVEHEMRISDKSSVRIEAGILDGVTGEPPTSEYLRTPQAGEQAGQPAYAIHAAWSHTVSGRPLTLGAGSYYNRQNWGFNRDVDGWAAIAGIEVPLGHRFSASGEFYRGRAVGGLGGAMGRSVVFSGDPADPGTQVLGLNSVGGWAQLKFAPTAKLEFNGAVGQENPFAVDLHRFSTVESYINPAIARNRAASVNVIARPRSNLVLSVEYRRLRTFELPATSEVANHINLGAGVLF